MRVVLTRRIAVEAVLLALLLPLSFFGLRWAATRYMRIVYPLHYTEAVEAAAAEYALPPSLLYAVVRTESNFRPEAVSSAGARGLMQITEETFAWAQGKLDEPSPLSADALYDPALNVRYGAYILSFLQAQFSDLDVALAAYNAGSGRVQQWLEDDAYSLDGKTLTAIPYAETAHYVQKVRLAQQRYQELYKME